MTTSTQLQIKPWYTVIDRIDDQIIIKIPKQYESILCDVKELYIHSKQYSENTLIHDFSGEELLAHLDAKINKHED